ncbi:hypothetical protein F443_16217, partial [Phytophthora nicotianae P1569]
MKARCKLLMENLQPAVLREQIERLVDLERRDCRTDDVALFDLILEHAKAQHRYHQLNKENTPVAATSRPAKNQVSKSQKQPATTTDRRTKPGAPAGTRPTKAAKPPVDGCLVCGGAHWLKECPTATEEQRKEALDKFRAAKKQCVRSKAAKGTGSLKTVRINNLVEVMYLPDTGADRSIIPSCVVETLRTVQPDLDVLRLQNPVPVTLADGRAISCVEEVKVDLALTTTAGLVHVRDVMCLVLQSEEDELLLGKDTLHGLGIDVDAMLAQLAGDGPLSLEDDEFPLSDAIP